MRKYILIILVVLLSIVSLLVVTYGYRIAWFEVLGYKEIGEKTRNEKQLVEELDNKNSKEFNTKTDALEKVTEEYQTTKAEYDKLVSDGQITNRTIYSSIDLYNMDYLWTKIGNYATEKNVTLQLNVTKSSTSTSVSSEYVMCDLMFTVTGGYIDITDFIYSIENDDSLGFEILDFAMEKGGENLQATFTVKNVPINSSTLSTIPTTVQ